MKTLAPILLCTVIVVHASLALAGDPLVRESEIPLGNVAGRIDHLAIDLRRERLFVAELGNNSVGVVDLKAGKAVRQLTGINAPQGVAYLASADTLYVASGTDGTLHPFVGPELKPADAIELGANADNVRADEQNNLVLVGYGAGLATVDGGTATDAKKIELGGHPEGFQQDVSASRIFVNLPGDSSVAVVDPSTGVVDAKWPLKGLSANFPMAFDAKHQRALIATREPSGLVVLQARQGDILQGEKGFGDVIYAGRTCGDADDLFFDAKRNRVYVICGQGFIDTFQYDANGYLRIGRTPTVKGARTGLFSPDRDRLYLAVSRQEGTPPAIWVYKPE